MPTILTTVPALPARAKIVFPTVEPSPSAPTIAANPPGAAAIYYYVAATWLYQDPTGHQYESLSSAVSGPLGMPSSSNLQVTTPSTPNPITLLGLIGWQLYVGSNSTGTGPTPTLHLQGGPIPIGTGFNAIPSSSGAQPPTSWGQELIFTYPARQLPYYNPQWHGHDDYSTFGVQQSITWWIDELVDFEIPYIDGGTDAFAWKTFLNSALTRTAFDFYPDSTLGTFKTLINIDTNPKMAYKFPGIYTLKLKCRVGIP